MFSRNYVESASDVKAIEDSRVVAERQLPVKFADWERGDRR